jgi:hypothetical protein
VRLDRVLWDSSCFASVFTNPHEVLSAPPPPDPPQGRPGQCDSLRHALLESSRILSSRGLDDWARVCGRLFLLASPKCEVTSFARPDHCDAPVVEPTHRWHARNRCARGSCPAGWGLHLGRRLPFLFLVPDTRALPRRRWLSDSYNPCISRCGHLQARYSDKG